MDMKGSVALKSQMLDTVEEVAHLVENRGISQVERNVNREWDWTLVKLLFKKYLSSICS